MNFRNSNRLKFRDETRIDVTNLVDVAFMLIIFYTLSASFAPSLKSDSGFDVDLPKASAREIPKEKRSINVAVDKNGIFSISGKRYSPDELLEYFKSESKKSSDIMLVIQADRVAQHGRVVELMDMAREAGIMRIGIATQEK
ncbi:MAG: biopolymer transporter ExbD [Deltaproteobacteria bacterium]|nr:biopolymer transporter ExbD [Deltaproteobacteria bacterium]